MLSGLILENFKAFRGRRVIPIRPITLIFGPNSAGKSAILQSLLLLKQTAADTSSGSSPLRLRGSWVDLGSFPEMVFGHDIASTCEVTPLLPSVEWSPDVLSDQRIENILRVMGPSYTYGLGVRFRQADQGSLLQVESLPVYLGDMGEPAALLQRIAPDDPLLIEEFGEIPFHPPHTPLRPVINRAHSGWNALYQEFMAVDVPFFSRLLNETIDENDRATKRTVSIHFDDVDRWLDLDGHMVDTLLQRYGNHSVDRYCDVIDEIIDKRFVVLGDSLKVSQHYLDLDDEGEDADLPYFLTHWDEKLRLSGVADFQVNLADLAEELGRNLLDYLNRLIYIGPLRQYPERHYLFSGSTPAHVGTSGQLAPDLLFNQPELVDQINDTLGNFQIGYRLVVERLRADDHLSDVYALRLLKKSSGVRVSLRDVGFGISQVLPVIVQALLAWGNTMLIEQPELHLHPRLQAELADVFIKAALQRHNTFLIETHSEHLVLRLMRRMRDTSRGTLPDGMPPVRPDDVSIIYVQPTDEGSIPIPIELDEEGDLLTAWPNGFFEEGFHERFA